MSPRHSRLTGLRHSNPHAKLHANQDHRRHFFLGSFMLSQTDTALHFFTQKEKKLFTYETAFGLTIITEKVFLRCLRGACRPATRHNIVPHRATPPLSPPCLTPPPLFSPSHLTLTPP